MYGVAGDAWKSGDRFHAGTFSRMGACFEAEMRDSEVPWIGFEEGIPTLSIFGMEHIRALGHLKELVTNPDWNGKVKVITGVDPIRVQVKKLLIEHSVFPLI